MSSSREYPIFSDTKGTSETQIRFKTQANGNRETGKKNHRSIIVAGQRLAF